LYKTGGKIHGENISPLPRWWGGSAGEGGAELRAEKAQVGLEQLISPCGESQALHCLGETKSKLKLKSHQEKNLISNS
jgi:hypothetical protein